MISVIRLTSTSACLELVNSTAYYAPEPYTILVDGAVYGTSNRNVFSLFGLKPDTSYLVEVRTESGELSDIAVHTRPESFCLNVQDFGAVGDGVHEDTQAIQTAIALLPENGRLYFPAGTYLTLPLSLKSHITLEFAEGAVLLGSPERERYPILPGTCRDMGSGKEIPLYGFEGNEIPGYQSLITASYAEHITLIGPGTIDGNGQNGDWWHGFEHFPAARPRVLFFNRCRHVVVHGVKVANGPTWHIHPFYSRHVALLDCAVEAPKDSPNTDGMDPESCEDVRIIGCRYSVGDDCIAIKSGKIEMGRRYRTPAARHIIRNCCMEFGHGAVTLGSELAQGIRDLTVSQCLFRSTDRGLRIKSRRGRGRDCIVSRVRFEDIRMEHVLTPIVINLWYNCCDPDRYSEYVWSREKLPVDDRTPTMGSFLFRNLNCTDAEVAACYIDGLTESPIERVEMENVHISFAENCRPGIPAMQNFAEERCRLGLYLDNVRSIRLRNVTVEGAEGPDLIADHYETLDTEGGMRSE